MSKLMLLGATVVFTAAANHLTKTVRSGGELEGSVFHPEETEFAAIVTRVREDGTADLLIFPPGRDPRAVDSVEEGKGPGKFRAVGTKYHD